MKRNNILIVMFVIVGLIASSAAASETSSQQIAKANRFQMKAERALRSGKLDNAKELFNRALEAAPSFPSAHIGLGQLAMGEGNFDLALEHFEQARDGYAELGQALLDIRTKRFAEAQHQINTIEDQIRQIESQGKGAADGMQAIDISKMQNQISQLQAIEMPDPADANEPPGEIYFYIGNALYQLGRKDEALEAWETSRERSPDFAAVYNNLALIYFERRHAAKAKASLDKAEELGFPVNPQFKQDVELALKSADQS
jgi:tetratricopeptide (TPR) repeat protein